MRRPSSLKVLSALILPGILPGRYLHGSQFQYDAHDTVLHAKPVCFLLDARHQRGCSTGVPGGTAGTSLSSMKTGHETMMKRDNIKDQNLIHKYLQRIHLSDHDDILPLTVIEESSKRSTTKNLQTLLTHHLRHVPFENMDLHSHPPPLISSFMKDDSSNDDACKDDKDEKMDKKQQNRDSTDQNIEFIPRRSKSKLPSLNVQQSLTKIIEYNRGGFCYELNLSFCWLLQKLGFRARLAVADVSCKQEIPAHVVILVDDVYDMNTKFEHDDSNHDLRDHVRSSSASDDPHEKKKEEKQTATYLVDVGFGCPGVCDVILPLEYNQIQKDHHGDLFRFDKDHPSNFPLHEGRFDTVLYRTRVDAPNEENPMYRFHSNDNMEHNAVEFQKGLEYVLHMSPTFNGKRLCVISTPKGHITLGSDYVKWVERWGIVKQEYLPDEESWRSALFRCFGVRLTTE